jgi:Tfp pilus assembly protein PilO
MKSISQTTRWLIILAVLTLAVASGYFLLFAEIRNTNRNISRLAGEADIVAQQSTTLRTLQSIVEITREDRAGINTFFLTEQEIVDFLEVIEGLREDTGASINVRSIGEGETLTNTLTKELHLNVTAEGSWEAVYHFLALLESLPYRIKLQQVQLSDSSTTTDEPSWSGVFNFSVTQLK